MKNKFFIYLLIVLMMAACGGKQPVIEDSLPAESESDQTEILPSVFNIWLPPYLPQGFLAGLNLHHNVLAVRTNAEADIWIDVGADNIISRWVYALVAPFPTVADEVRLSDLQGFWLGQVVPDFPTQRIVVNSSTKVLFEKIWGSAAAENVEVVAEQDILSKAKDFENTWAIVPFDNLEPYWKVIVVNGASPIRKGFNPFAYPLSIPFSLNGTAQNLTDFSISLAANNISSIALSSNYDAQKLTTVVLTGVTAMVRGTAYLMEQNGLTYPALEIGHILREADITHISNEIPFTASCPTPFMDPHNESRLVFCSKPAYIALLEAVGTNVVELTGDHFRDWGAEAMLKTIEMYEQRGWGYYGGGKNLADGQKPFLIEHNGNRIAFLGCNAKPAGYASATEDQPGAVSCDMQFMAEKIQEVKNEGYLPIVTFQHIEYYSYKASPILEKDFRAVADAGAVIVSGSQAHQPHAIEFYQNAFLHYGLGNLFFDQFYEGLPQRQAFIDRHVIYDGKHISTELITILFVDMARTRLMTPEERDFLLRDVFFASGW